MLIVNGMLHIFYECPCICDIRARRAEGEQCLTSGTATVNCCCTIEFIDTKGRKWGKTTKCRNYRRWKEDHAVRIYSQAVHAESILLYMKAELLENLSYYY